MNRWQKPGDENYTNIPVLSNNEGRVNELQEYETAYSLWEMYDYANVRVVSGNFLKCNALSLTYMFDTALVKKIGMQNLSLSLDVARPFVIKSKDLKGRDPEQMDLGSGAMPPLRSYAFALSVTF